MSYLLDADWIINALSGRRQAATILTRLAPQRIAVSVITLGEVYEGAFHSPNPQAHLATIREFLSPFRSLPVTDPIVVHFAELRSLLRRRGELISDFDLLLGATALQHDITVLTYNVRHLSRIPDLNLYQPS